MDDPLELFWPVVDAVEPIMAADGAEAGAIERLVDAGLIGQTAPAEHITCPECADGHMESVIDRDGPHGRSRFFIQCPRNLRVEVFPERLLRWAVDFRALVQALATELSLRGRRSELTPGRLWRLGRTTWQGSSRDVLFARGLLWADAGAVVTRLGRSTHPIVLVAEQIPASGVWDGRVPPIVALSQVSHLCDGQLVIDVADLFATVKDQDESENADPAPIVDDKRLKLVVRQQVKAESKSQLTDDLVVAAYVEHGSSRKAAESLTKAGHSVHHSTVARIVQKAEQALRGESSESIVRTVASQRRDGKKKIHNRPEAKDWA